MGNELDEDLIEATIRRVAEAKAARAAAPGESAPESDPPMGDPGEDAPSAADAAATRAAEVNRVDAMIRHVAASKAARVPDAPRPAPELTDGAAGPDEDPIEATIRRVAAEKAARLPDESPAAVAAPPPAAELADEAADPDEDPIEATVRRVAAEKAARVSDVDGARAPEVPPELAARPADEADDTHTDPPAAAAAPASIEPDAGLEAPRPLHVMASVPARRQGAAAVTGESELARTVSQLRRELDVTRRALELLTARVDALGAAPVRHAAAAPSSDDDWDEVPSLSRIPSGPPVRPAIFRDPSPHTATAERLEPDPDGDVVDARPLPAPLPPLQPVPKRGFDLLPRTYRVTVEDKRRGVDLVPLHRALLGMDGVRDMSLLSYSNGTAIVSLDTLDELNPDALCQAISRAMSRDARVEVHNEQTMVVKMAEE